MVASKEGNKSVVSLLLSRGADSSLYDIYGWTALHFASSWGRRDTAHILLVDGKANVNARPPRQTQLIAQLKKGDKDTKADADNDKSAIKEDNSTGMPAICVAAIGGQVDVLKLLLQYGADINLSDVRTGHSALSMAAEHGMTSSVQTLVDYGANLNRRSEVTGATALMTAIAAGKHSCIIRLLDAFADLNILDYQLSSAWEVAVRSGNQETLLGAMLQSSRRAKVNVLPWLQMHFAQLSDYHRWDEFHVHDAFDLFHNRDYTVEERERNRFDILDGEDDEEGDDEVDDEEESKVASSKRRGKGKGYHSSDEEDDQDGLNAGGRGRNQRRRPRGRKDGSNGVIRRSRQQRRYLKRSYATAGQYLQAFLSGREGAFSGLFSLPGDCDVYLPAALILLLSACLQAPHVPEDALIFRSIFQQLGEMLCHVLQSNEIQTLPRLVDVFLLGQEPVERLLPELLAATSYHNAARLLSSAFICGPWAMYLDTFAQDFQPLGRAMTYQVGAQASQRLYPAMAAANAKGISQTYLAPQHIQPTMNAPAPGLLWQSAVSDVFLQPRIQQMLFEVSTTWDREHGVIVDGYGYYSERLLYLRYTPRTMYYLEGIGRALLSLLILIYAANARQYEVFLYPTLNSTAVDLAQDGISGLEALMAITIISLLLYECGLLEEKRWTVSPAPVFLHDALEHFRWKRVADHFFDDPYKLLDLLSLLLGLLWFVGRFAVYFYADFPVKRGSLLLTIATQSLTLCLVPQTLGLARYLGTYFPEFGKTCFSLAFLIYDLWPYLLVYVVMGVALGGAIGGLLQLSSFNTFQYLVDFLFFQGAGSFSDSTNDYLSRVTRTSDVHAVYKTLLLLMIALWFPTAGIVFLSIIQRLFQRQQTSNGTHNGSNSVLVEKYYYYWHARRIQEHSLALEKSALCMLPPPLNILAVGYYIPHVYLSWRARLRFDIDITLSMGGFVTDCILFTLMLLPCAIYEYYLKNVYGVHRIVTQNHATARADLSPESNFGRLMGLLYMPFGLPYTIFCLVYKFSQDTAPRLLIKSRLADGRCRLSRGIVRDIYEANLLARLEDYRLHAHLRLYASSHAVMNKEYEYSKQKGNVGLSESSKAAAYVAMGGILGTSQKKKAFSTVPNAAFLTNNDGGGTFSANSHKKYTEDIYTTEFSEYLNLGESSRMSMKPRNTSLAFDDDNSSAVSGQIPAGSLQAASTAMLVAGYDDEDKRRRLKKLKTGFDETESRLTGDQHSRIPKHISLWGAGANESNSVFSAKWMSFRRRYRPTDYVGRKIKIVPHRPFLQLRLIDTQGDDADASNAARSDAPSAMPKNLSLDQLLKKMVVQQQRKQHQALLTKQKNQLLLGALDAASLIGLDGELIDENEEDFNNIVQRNRNNATGAFMFPQKDYWKKPRLVFAASKKSDPVSKTIVEEPDNDANMTPLDIIAERELSLYQAGMESERQWALLAYEHDIVPTHNFNLQPSYQASNKAHRNHLSPPPQYTLSLTSSLAEEQTHLQHQPSSLYFPTRPHPPIFTARERQNIFRVALPEYFPSDFAWAMRDVDTQVQSLSRDLPKWLETQTRYLLQQLAGQHIAPAHQPFYDTGTSNHHAVPDNMEYYAPAGREDSYQDVQNTNNNSFYDTTTTPQHRVPSRGGGVHEDATLDHGSAILPGGYIYREDTQHLPPQQQPAAQQPQGQQRTSSMRPHASVSFYDDPRYNHTQQQQR